MATRRKARKATLRRKPAATSALKRALAERDEALKFQAATQEILVSIKASRTDAQPVFDAIVQGALRIFDGVGVGIVLVRGSEMDLVATTNPISKSDFPMRLTTDSVNGTAILRRRVVNIGDVDAAGVPPRARANAARFRAIAVAPLLRQGQAIGAISVTRKARGALSDKQLALLQTFADQAVIAIENARLFNETKEALERQTAIAEILRVISASPTDVQPVLRSVVQSAVRLSGADNGSVVIIENGVGAVVADYGVSEQRKAFLESFYRRNPLVPGRGSLTGRVLLERRSAQIPDMQADVEYNAVGDAEAPRSLLGVPLMKSDEIVGVIVLRRRSPGIFSEQHVKLVEAFAHQAVIAIENVRLFNETKEALERQTATAEILKVIASSPSEVQPVFDAIVLGVSRLFGRKAALRTVEADGLHRRARSYEPEPGEYHGRDVEALDRRSIVGQAVLEGRALQWRDTLVEGAATYGLEEARKLAFRSIASAPLMRGGGAIGVISVSSPTPGLLTASQMELLTTFADQAVIAIENVRLFNETREALEQQTATAEVLKVISASPTSVAPVFDAILRSAVTLCGAELAAVFPFDGKLVHLGATHNWPPAALEYFSKVYPSPPSPSLLSGRTIIAKSIVQIVDAATDEHYDPDSVATGHWRRMLGAPMLRGGRPLGALVVAWRDPGETPRRQVELLQTFADQAAIAIENVRLFNETKEALEQQTATADILKVISSSPSDTQPVFDAIVQSATKLVPGGNPGIVMLEGRTLFHHAIAGPDMDAEARERIAKFFPAPFNPAESPLSRSISECAVVEIPDNEAPGLPAKYALAARAMDYRSLTFVPLVREGVGIGAIAISHSVAGFRLTEKQLALLKTFADQAVIAIENVRLFNETKEALAQQTALSEVLAVISRSPGNLAPVLETVAVRAATICEATDARLFLVNGDRMEYVAGSGDLPVVVNTLSLTRASVVGRAVIDRAAVQVDDIMGPAGEDLPVGREVAARTGWRTALAVPLMRDERALGAISLRRRDVHPFSAKHVALLKTFADQAVVAIENARLFNETKEALDQQKASAEVLGAISGSIADTRPVFEKILASCERLFEGELVGITLAEGDTVRLIAYHGPNSERLRQIYPLPLTRESGTGWAILNAQIAHFPDIEAPRVPPGVVAGCRSLGVRAIVFAPMLFEGKGIGAIWVARAQVGAFTDKQIAQLRTFADQAVIAIQNARLFREIQEKSAQLEVANKHKSDFLANMSHELRTPLNAIIGFSEVLSERMFGEVNEKQAEYLKDIHESGRHLLSLINDILDLSKIEAGRMELELSSFDLPGAVSNAMTLVRERAQRHGIALGLEMDPGLGELQADERKVKQILLNLLSNAVKFTPDGGKVDVSTRKVDGRIEIAVRDTGIGIAPEDHAAVFEEFKQVGRDYTRKAEGTGLGLALTKRLVELHGGEISLESEPGKGSTFTVKLPLR